MGIHARFLEAATAVPAYELDQGDVMKRVQGVFGSRSAVVERLLPVFANTGIERRYSCVPIDWYYDEHGWPDRNAIYLASAVDLLERATTDVLARAGRTPQDVDTIVVVSTTGIATPSLDALLMERLPFKRTARRLPIFGLGCAGGVLGLARAAAMAQSRPGSLVLFLVVELCALSFRKDDFSKSNIVATALFGDGAAAALLSTQGSGPAIAASGECTFPNSLDIMGWEVADDGLKAIFSRDIPALVDTEMRGVASAHLAESNLTLRDVDTFLCHPGGAKVLDALEGAFQLESGSLVESRGVLRDFGNMSAATVMFVLERALHGGSLASPQWQRALVTSMGPGFTAAFVTLER
ncbi:MAG TPA: type III polyketide synthase [Candidatus Baltobacteraceae bacterium]